MPTNRITGTDGIEHVDPSGQNTIEDAEGNIIEGDLSVRGQTIVESSGCTVLGNYSSALDCTDCTVTGKHTLLLTCAGLSVDEDYALYVGNQKVEQAEAFNALNIWLYGLDSTSQDLAVRAFYNAIGKRT